MIDGMCISHIVGNLFFQLCLSFRRINSLTCSLYDIWSTIKLGSVTSCPEVMKGNIFTDKIFRNNCKTKTYAGKSCILGKASKLNRTGTCALTLIDTVRHIFLCDISLIGGIVDDHSTILVCIVYPFLELVLRDCCTAWVIREAEIDNIRSFHRKFRKKTVIFQTRHIDHSVKVLVLFVVIAGTSCHNICIYIYRINRVADCYFVVCTKNLLNVSRITFGSVRNKDLIGTDLASACLIVIFCDRTSQEFISEIRCIAMESLGICHLIYRFVKCLDDCRCKRLCDITDSKTHDLNIRICGLIRRYFFCNSGKKITAWQFQIISIYCYHNITSPVLSDYH